MKTDIFYQKSQAGVPLGFFVENIAFSPAASTKISLSPLGPGGVGRPWIFPFPLPISFPLLPLRAGRRGPRPQRDVQTRADPCGGDPGGPLQTNARGPRIGLRGSARVCPARVCAGLRVFLGPGAARRQHGRGLFRSCVDTELGAMQNPYLFGVSFCACVCLCASDYRCARRD